MALLRWNLFTYRDLWRWIDDPYETPPEVPQPVQLVSSGPELDSRRGDLNREIDPTRDNRACRPHQTHRRTGRLAGSWTAVWFAPLIPLEAQGAIMSNVPAFGALPRMPSHVHMRSSMNLHLHSMYSG